MNRNADVDAWFAAKDPPMAETMQRVRGIILGADDRVAESIKWSTPTFEFNGNIASFAPAKKLVSLLFHRGTEIPESEQLRIGLRARLKPGETAPLTVSWRQQGKKAAVVDYGSGTLPVPSN